MRKVRTALYVVAGFVLGVVVTVGVTVWAQSNQADTGTGARAPLGDVITGDKIGFQRTKIETLTKDGRVYGEWVVKVDGKWLMTQAPIR